MARFTFCVAILWSALGVPAADAQDFGKLLGAGDFGPAAAMAEAAGGGERDRMLAELAKAQAAAGASRASFSTASGVGDDASRRELVNFLGGAPIGAPVGGAGGAAMADFDSLIQLVTATISPDSWEDVGGPGAVEPFPGGVYVDASGVLKKIRIDDGDRTLAASRRGAAASDGNREVRLASTLRKVSLARLERRLQVLRAQGLDADDAMANLAGIQKIKYVFLYPDSGDIVIAGPAGDWKRDGEGRAVSVATGLPTLQLDDLIVMLRTAQQEDPTFGCNITPVKERLAATQAFLNESAKTPLKPGTRGAWLERLRSTLGKQDIEVFGLDPRTRAARVLVEADYRMKLVGMGLEDGVPGVESYLDLIKVGPDGKVPPMTVLRWWFTLNYDAIHATPDRSAFEIRGQGVQVLSENELLSKLGDRIHTGRSNEPTWQFAHSFTRHFQQLAAKYPIYAELRNVFDLALVAQLIRSEDLAARADWQMLHFLDAEGCPVELATAPTQVETVVNHRLVNGRQIIAGVSGGVRADMRKVVTPESISTDDYGQLDAERGEEVPSLPRNAWWWD